MVYSHGLFMMSSNRWDSLSKTFSRPLGLSIFDDDDDDDSSVMIRISHRIGSPQSLHIRVRTAHSLSPKQRRTILAQVAGMLRLCDEDEALVRGFPNMVKAISLRRQCLK
ncbi:hypothetical protein HS088_TW17G00670 [Tripterygium wilfordii]|uniref:Uncharacterized protein n=1 Tax=Tripterygium wilfordii TaxID=458696 RepID=A0A7J7CGF0_TRIWF|nr:hypothetical protein HS088_TW17G00670 [Tripterygium wilfordii]